MPGPVPWVGGKRNLAARLVGRIEAVPHTCYAEPFLGMGGVFLRRRQRARVEVINDLAGDVVNLFRLAQRHPHALVHELRWGLVSRQSFRRLLATDPATLTDIERAARFVSIQRLNYGGIPGNRSFPATTTGPRGKGSGQWRRYLFALHRRLERVTIEQLPFDVLLERYDRPATLFYCDPPYWGCEDYYGEGLFSRADQARLAAALRSIRGRFILSLNDRPEVRALYDWARLEPVELTYHLAGRGGSRAAELLIYNY